MCLTHVKRHYPWTNVYKLAHHYKTCCGPCWWGIASIRWPLQMILSKPFYMCEFGNQTAMRFHWYRDPNTKDTKTLRFTRALFGLAPSPFPAWESTARASRVLPGTVSSRSWRNPPKSLCRWSHQQWSDSPESTALEEGISTSYLQWSPAQITQVAL